MRRRARAAGWARRTRPWARTPRRRAGTSRGCDTLLHQVLTAFNYSIYYYNTYSYLFILQKISRHCFNIHSNKITFAYVMNILITRSYVD